MQIIYSLFYLQQMKKILLFAAIATLMLSCKEENKTAPDKKPDSKLAAMFDSYYNERMSLFPIDATIAGEKSHNDKLYADFTDSYREKLKSFYTKYKDSIVTYNYDALDANDQISYDIFKREMDISLDGLNQPSMYIPFQQFWGVPLTMGQLGSGDGSQPFKTVADYDAWIKRMEAFTPWADSAIVYFQKGMANNVTLPASLVVKILPQMDAMVVNDATQSLFYQPIKKFPADFSDADKKRLSNDYIKAITVHMVPSYKKLRAFLSNEYLLKARVTTGISAVNGGSNYYNFLIKYWTTTTKTPDEIYNTGLAEVARIKGEMNKTMKEVGFKDSLRAFFEYMKTDQKFMPYKTPEEVLNGFRAIQQTIDPNLKKMFGRTPKTPFEIRQTEAFRAASASAEYQQAPLDGSKPGIFYVPILDATKYNVTGGFESLFLHEAIPGHHYQISLQQEDTLLPKFRRVAWYGAMGEGWALYCESLGKELGLYTDPYQYMGALGDEMHRAVRLVVDVAMHTKNMTREEAIKYMMENEAISEEGAVAEIERYMAIPGQALSYKIGALKIRELRNKYEKDLGTKFNLAAFHDELLKDGIMPLDILEKKMNSWAAAQK